MLAGMMRLLLLLLALPLVAGAQDNAADLSKVRSADDQGWDEARILETAEARIQQHRTGAAEIRVLDRDGRPLANTAVRVRLVRHEFMLGCNAFPLGPVLKRGLDPAARQVYGDRFAALLNYATLPYYWSYYEPEPGQTAEEDVRQMAAWCRERGIAVKGHPLAWHETFPAWAKELSDEEVRRRQIERITDLMRRFKGTIDRVDVINEATVSAKFDNAIGRWVKERGAANLAADFLKLAHEANPEAELLYNDFNVSADFEQLVADLLEKQAPFHAVGIQSHMHKELWPVEKLWTVCETYARFGKPLHFTELTILSGSFKAKDDNDWHTVRTDWNTTPEGEQRQLEYGRKVYTVLFSHPAVDAVTWWDFSDRGSWAGAPAGLLRKDMSPKPLYDWLMEAFHQKWTTDVVVQSDASGTVRLRAFYGDYQLTATNGSGASLESKVSFAKRGPAHLQATLR